MTGSRRDPDALAAEPEAPPPDPAPDPAAAEARRVSMLRMQLVDLHPFWGHLLLHVRLIQAPKLATLAATDGVRRIWYNPHYTQHLDIRQLGFVLAHELGHHLLLSSDRARGRDARLWNRATDYAINRIVAAISGSQGYPLYRAPSGFIPGLGDVRPLLDPRFDGMVAEAIYEHLAAEELPAPRRITVELGADLVLPGVLDHGGGIDLHLPVELSSEDREVLRDRLRDALGVWAQTHHRGDAAGDLARQVAAQSRPRIPWQRLLHRFAGQALGSLDYSLARPNRRYLAEDLVVPGLVDRGAPDVVVAVDTSGSMPDALLAAVATELAALADIAPELLVLLADARVQRVIPSRELPSFLCQTRFQGGGGTDHRPVFAWLAEHKPHPDLFIGLTDLRSRFPERPPRFPVLWVTPAEHNRAPWGRVVEARLSSDG